MSEENEELRMHVYRNFSLIYRNMTRHWMSRLQEQKSFIDPSRGQGRVLSILKMKPEISQKELLYLLDTSKQSLAELLSKLEKSGYIVREPSQEDRRVMIVKLTEVGKNVEITSDKESIKKLAYLDNFDISELEVLNKFLEKILVEFEKELEESDDFEERKKIFEEFMEAHGSDLRKCKTDFLNYSQFNRKEMHKTHKEMHKKHNEEIREVRKQTRDIKRKEN